MFIFYFIYMQNAWQFVAKVSSFSLMIYPEYKKHYNDVIMSPIVSQITRVFIVCLTVGSDKDQRKHQSSASLALVREFTGDRWIPRTKGQ